VTRRFWAPGRVNLIGEFTDLAGGVALPVALDLGITLVAEPAPTIELRSRELDELVSLAADGSGDATGFGRYVSGVASELALLGRPPAGLRGELRSTLPIGAISIEPGSQATRNCVMDAKALLPLMSGVMLNSRMLASEMDTL